MKTVSEILDEIDARINLHGKNESYIACQTLASLKTFIFDEPKSISPERHEEINQMRERMQELFKRPKHEVEEGYKK